VCHLCCRQPSAQSPAASRVSAASQNTHGTADIDSTHANGATVPQVGEDLPIIEGSTDCAKKAEEAAAVAADQADGQVGLAAQVPAFQARIQEAVENLAEKVTNPGQQTLYSIGEKLTQEAEAIAADVEKDAHNVLIQAADSLENKVTANNGNQGAEFNAENRVCSPEHSARASMSWMTGERPAESSESRSCLENGAEMQHHKRNMEGNDMGGRRQVSESSVGDGTLDRTLLGIRTLQRYWQPSHESGAANEHGSQSRLLPHDSPVKCPGLPGTEPRSSSDYREGSRCSTTSGGATSIVKRIDVTTSSMDDEHEDHNRTPEMTDPIGAGAPGGTAVTVARGNFIEFQNSALWAMVSFQPDTAMQFLYSEIHVSF
jgi:hypothetical protein